MKNSLFLKILLIITIIVVFEGSIIFDQDVLSIDKIISRTLKTEGNETKSRVIFEGDVYLMYDSFIDFKADKIIFDYIDTDKIKHIELLCNVVMKSTKRREIIIHSQKASSDNFNLYIDFAENVSVVFKSGLEIRPKNVRYHFISGEMENLEENDILSICPQYHSDITI